MTQVPTVATDADRNLNRRGLCQSALASLGLSVVMPLMGCGVLPTPSGSARNSSEARGVAAALLLPLTGSLAALGQNMGRAAGLVTQGLPAGLAVPVMDTGDTAETAAAAAKQAISGGAKLLLGPLRADQTPAVLAVAGNVPVVTFSNDDALAAQGAFVMGVTPAQSVSTMFSYARAQGVARIALVAANSPLGTASAAAASRIAAAGGISLTATLLRDPGTAGLVAALREASGGTLPDAVFLPDGGAALKSFAAALKGAGVQILGSVQWGVGDVAADRNLQGAWFAAPPPDLFLPFADRFQAAFGEPPGIVAALGHDAALLAKGLSSARTLNRKGLTRSGGFTGVLGGFRFLANGQCQRDLSVLGIDGDSLSVLGEVTGT